MVSFIFGGAGSGKSTLVFDRIEKTLAESTRSVCLIVPEQHTVAVERRAAERFPASAALRLEVTNFTRLADSISRRVGDLSYSKLTRGARQLLVWRALMSVYEGLTELGGAGVDEVALVPTVYSALRELTLGGISPRELSEAADCLEKTEGESSLSRRAHDLSLVASAVAALSDGEYAALEDPVLRVRDRAEKSGYFNGCEVFIDSFYSMTGAQLAALGEIIRLADSVTLTVPMDSPSADGIHLSGVRGFYKSVLGAALKHGEVERVTLSGNHRTKSESLAYLAEHLWDYSSQLPPCENDGSISVYSVADRYEEAQALCSEIAHLVRGGAAYSDIAVVAADVERLRGITDGAMRSHGIPVFIAEAQRVMTSPAVRLIFSLLRVVGHWRREDIISIVKTGLSPLDDTSACAFENYTETWSIRTRAMFTSAWSMNPDGYTEHMSERARETLHLANEAREVLIAPLERFSTVFENGRAKISDICAALTEYFDESGAYKKMLSRAETLPRDDAARERLVWGEICSAFDTLVDIAGDALCDSTGFASLFRFVISDSDTGAIPTGVDNVTLASAASLRCDGVKHVILLGVVDGEFPAVPSSDGYFSDSDRERLAEGGVVLGTSGDVRASEELFRFYRAVAQASHSLTVFIPKSTAGSPCRASEGAQRIMSLAGAEVIRYSSLPAERRIYDRASLDSELRLTHDSSLERLRVELYGELPRLSETVTDDTHIDPESAKALFGRHMSLTQSRIERFVSCPMSYYCTYILHLEENKKASVASPDIGSFVHALLEQFFTVTAGEKYPLPRERADSICESITEDYIRRTLGEDIDGRLSYLFVRLRRKLSVFLEAIMEELSQSRFEIYRTELPVGIASGKSDAASPPPISFECSDGTDVSLYGVIDRLDLYRADGKTYIRVIDYKTGRRRFSYENVKLGLDVQLLLYLFSAWRSENSSFAREISDGELLPAGAMYLSIRPGDPSTDSPVDGEAARELIAKSIERSGIVSDERDVLDAMDRGISGKYVPVTLKADGSYRSASLASLERFGELYGELGETVCKIADEMKSGLAAPRPINNAEVDPCAFCSAGEICRRRRKQR